MVSELSCVPRELGLRDPLTRIYSAKSSRVFWLYARPPGSSGSVNGIRSVSPRKPRNHERAVPSRSRSAASWTLVEMALSSLATSAKAELAGGGEEEGARQPFLERRFVQLVVPRQVLCDAAIPWGRDDSGLA